jgi:hypothetical protein
VSEGEGAGQFRPAIDPAIRKAFDALPAKVREQILSRLNTIVRDPAEILAVLVEGQWMIQGSAIDGDTTYFYSGVRFAYDPARHRIVITSIPQTLLKMQGMH